MQKQLQDTRLCLRGAHSWGSQQTDRGRKDPSEKHWDLFRVRAPGRAAAADHKPVRWYGFCTPKIKTYNEKKRILREPKISWTGTRRQEKLSTKEADDGLFQSMFPSSNGTNRKLLVSTSLLPENNFYYKIDLAAQCLCDGFTQHGAGEEKKSRNLTSPKRLGVSERREGKIKMYLLLTTVFSTQYRSECPPPPS